MPFKSKAQQRWMFSQKPEMAKEWADKTPDISKLPEHVQKMAFGGETNPNKETVKSMENNPTAGFADGGEAFNAPQGDWEALKAAIAGNQNKPQIDPLEQTGETDPGHISSAINSLGSGMALGSLAELPSMLKGLGEAGEVSLGNAPEMEGMGPKIEVFVKGVQKGYKGSPDIKLYGVKGAPEDLMKEFGDPNPGSVPEHILKAKGLLPDTSIDASGQDAPNSYANGGEVRGYDEGGDVTDPSDEAAQLMSGQGNAMPFLQGAAQFAAAPADMNNAQQLGVSGAFPPPSMNDFIHSVNMSQAPNEGPVGPGPQYMDQPQPQAPGLSQVAQNVQNMPPTNPSIYQGISADDRAALMQKLLAQKASPGNLAVSGIAGLGDAISNAFGRGGQHTQQDIRNAQQQNIGNQVGVMDTQRQQKMQDVQASIAQQEADPNSPISQGMRAFLKAQGMNVPSGMSGGMLKQVLPDVTKIFDSHMQAATQGNAQAIEAAKSVMGESLWQQIKESVGISEGPAKGEQYLENRLPGTTSSNGGWSVVK